VESADEIPAAWEQAKAGRVNQGRVIVESMIEFDYEITLLTVRSLGPAGIETSFCAPVGHVQIKGDYVESWQPMAMSPAALEKARSIAGKITEALGGRGIFGVELFVQGEDVFFSEVSPRPHDTGMVTMATQFQNEFELHARAILKLPVDVTMIKPGASAVIYGGMNEKGIAFDDIDKALAVPRTNIRLFGKPESFIKRRMGVALALADDTESARKNAKLAASLVKPVKP
jgi:phosphoribosylglycinamide formyltransferase 2